MKENENIIITKNKNNTLYWLTDSKNMNLSLYGVEVEKDLIYVTDNHCYNNKIIRKHNKLINKKFVEIRTQIEDILSKNLIQYLRLYKLININDYSFYDSKFIYNVGREIALDLVYDCNTNFHIQYIDYFVIKNNIVVLKEYDRKIEFNLATKEVELYYRDKKTNYLNFFYGKETLNNIIAKEQYKRGIAPKKLNEFVNLQKFLTGKKSVKIVTKNFKEYICKSGYFDNVFNLIDYNYSKENFKISNMYLKEYKDIDIKDILCFKYGSKDYYINTTLFEEKVS